MLNSIVQMIDIILAFFYCLGLSVSLQIHKSHDNPWPIHELRRLSDRNNLLVINYIFFIKVVASLVLNTIALLFVIPLIALSVSGVEVDGQITDLSLYESKVRNI